MKVIVIGLGAMGSSVSYHLAKRGIEVVGIDQFSPPHAFGSSHGDTRILRLGYAEGMYYVPLVLRARELWKELSNESGIEIFSETGVLSVRPNKEGSFKNSLKGIESFGIKHELLSSADISDVYGVIKPEDDMIGLLDKESGVVHAERAIETHLAKAQIAGAKLFTDERVLKIDFSSTVEVKTDKNTFSADAVVVSAGAWLTELLTLPKLNFEVERQVFFFLDVGNDEKFSPENLPVVSIEYGEPARNFYCIQNFGKGFKIARHHEGKISTVNNVDREVHLQERDDIENLFSRFFNGLPGNVLESKTCLYTNTPTRDFLIDFHPDHDNALILSPCSGHGFKFSSVIGEISADLLEKGKSDFNLEEFSFEKHYIDR
jgi:sarcosine oxidase